MQRARGVWLLVPAVVLVAGAAGTTRGADDARLNVLFVMSDDLNCDLGCYGHPLVKSPNIDALAARGRRFEKAYCQYPVCNPSRASLMTGRYPNQTGVLSNGPFFRDRLPDTITMPQWFRQHGYNTARVGKIYHYGVPTQIGTDGMDDPASWDEVVNPIGEDKRQEEKIHSLVKGQFGGTLSWLNLDTADEAQTDGQGATAMIGLLEKYHPDKTGEPFFLAMGFYRPHTPYVAPSKYFDLYDRDKIQPVMEVPGDRDDIPPAALADRPHQRELTIPQRKEIIEAYYAATSYMDAQLGRILEALDRLDLTDKTVVVFVSDHGYHLGAHGLWQKSDLFEGSARVPLIIAQPGMNQPGEATRSLAEMIDLYRTLAEICGLPEPPPEVEGKSLAPILEDPSETVRSSALTVTLSRNSPARPKPEGFSIRTPRYRYTEWGMDASHGRELYDYRKDPQELTNLADDPEHRDIVERLSRRLERRKKDAGVVKGAQDAI